MKLSQIKEALDAHGFVTKAVAPSADDPYPHVLASLDDEQSGPFVLQVGYLPAVDDELDHVRLLQLFVPIAEPKRGRAAGVLETLNTINRELALPGFALDPDAGLVYYRYVLPIPKGAPSPALADELVEVVQLVHFFVSLYSGPVTAAASGATNDPDLH